MRHAIRIGLVALWLALFIWCQGIRVHAEPAKREEVKPIREWKGSVADESLRKLAPGFPEDMAFHRPLGFITDDKTFTKLWQAWKVGDKVPTVDFTKELVVVATTRAGQGPIVIIERKGAGNLEVEVHEGAALLPGFRYRILSVPREGVKTVNGKEQETAPHR